MKTFKGSRRVVRSGIAIGSLAIGLAGAVFPLAAYAQDAASDAASVDEVADNNSDIIVTGTLIRGKAPVGSNSITVGQQRLEETGAQTPNQLLASIPQVSNYFNRVPLADLGITVTQLQITRPNIRNISPVTASSSATLILVDGHRIASAGVNQASIDPDLLPTGAIERVDVVTEGGSATYGADAVAGVINFITLRKFDGVKVDAHYGFADSYSQWDASITAGKSWDSGSAWISYSYTKSDALYGRDRDFIRNLDYSSQPYRSKDIECANPNLSVNSALTAFGNFVFQSQTYGAPNFVANTSNRCDLTDNRTIVPESQRHGVMAGLTQELGSDTTVDVRAYYGQRKTRGYSELTGSVTVTPDNPYAATSLPPGLTLGLQPYLVFGSPVVNLASVSFSLSPIVGLQGVTSLSAIKEWGANIELKHDLGENWQVRALANWSQSDSSYSVNQISSTRLIAAGVASTTATAFNPFNVLDNSPALIADLLDSEIAARSKDSLIQLRLLAEGKLFDLPGGDARLAFGYEFMHDRLGQRFGSDIRIGTLSSLPESIYSRSVHSAFGELQLPVFDILTLSAAARFDHYSDFGNTFNPKFGATFKPTPWLTVRGNWGTSFTAPTPVDQLGSFRNIAGINTTPPFIKEGDVPTPGLYAVAIQGSFPGLKPQTAETWSVGIDVEPTHGLRLSGSYYDVKFKDVLSIPTPGPGIFVDFPQTVQSNATGLDDDIVRQFAIDSGVADALAKVEAVFASGGKFYETIDYRINNYGVLHVKGLDLSANYSMQTGFGSIDASTNWNVQLSRKSQVSAISAVTDTLARETPRYSFQTSVGANIGNFRAQATWNHTGGYDIARTLSVPAQDRVDPFNTVNLFFKYDVSGESKMLKDLSFTLNLNNIFDTDPPVLRRNGQNEFGYANGFTLGRMVILGVSKRF